MTTRRPHPAPIARSAFTGFRFPPDVIVLAVRWYLRFGLSYRDVEEQRLGGRARGRVRERSARAGTASADGTKGAVALR
jgi:hypothetical protein